MSIKKIALDKTVSQEVSQLRNEIGLLTKQFMAAEAGKVNIVSV